MLKPLTKFISITLFIYCLTLFCSEINLVRAEETFVIRTKSLEKQLENLIKLAGSNPSYDFDQNLLSSVNEMKSLGFNSASKYSLNLIEKVNANSVSESSRITVLNAAEKLSPQNPQVLLNLSLFIVDLGVYQSLSHLYSGITELPNHPIYVSKILSKIFLLLNFTLLLTLIAVVFGNLVFSSGEVISFIASNFRKNSRIVISSILMILIYLLPFFVPLFFLLIMWSVIVAFGSSRMRFAPLISSFLVLTFVSVLPYGLKAISFANSTVGQAIDEIQTKDFDLDSEFVLNKSEPLYNTSQVIPILISRNQHLNGENDKALENYRASLATGISDKGLFYLVQSNIAQIEFNNGKQDLAFESWKKLYDAGWREYELLFNLSVSSVATYKKQEYEKYFGEFRNRFRTEEINFSRNIKPIISSIPNSSIFNFVLSTIKSEDTRSIIKTEKIEEILLGSDAIFIKIFSILTFIWGISLASKNQARYRYRVSVITDRSQLNLNQFSLLGIFPLLNFFIEKREWTFFVCSSFFLFVTLILLNIGNVLSLASENLGIIFLQIFASIYILAFFVRAYKYREQNDRL